MNYVQDLEREYDNPYIHSTVVLCDTGVAAHTQCKVHSYNTLLYSTCSTENA